MARAPLSGREPGDVQAAAAVPGEHRSADRVEPADALDVVGAQQPVRGVVADRREHHGARDGRVREPEKVADFVQRHRLDVELAGDGPMHQACSWSLKCSGRGSALP